MSVISEKLVGWMPGEVVNCVVHVLTYAMKMVVNARVV